MRLAGQAPDDRNDYSILFNFDTNLPLHARAALLISSPTIPLQPLPLTKRRQPTRHPLPSNEGAPVEGLPSRSIGPSRNQVLVCNVYDRQGAVDAGTEAADVRGVLDTAVEGEAFG